MDLEKVAEFLEIGLRPLSLPKELCIGDIKEGYALIPTYKGEWIREGLKQKGTKWEGSYIPLIIYKSNRAAILIPHDEREIWKNVRDEIQKVLEIPVELRGD